MIKAYNLETKELLEKYKTQQEVADAFDLTWEAVKGYFYRKKIYGEAKILNHKTNTWCYLIKEEEGKSINYKERCLNAIEYIKNYTQKYDTDGRVAELDEFNILASPKKLLEILEGNNNE